MVEDFEHCYRALRSRDPRFDGWFFAAVTTTGIYCRPSCPARTPARPNVRFYPSAAAAQQGGFRACLRCRPDAVPGSPEWNGRTDVVSRAMRCIAEGLVDREGVEGLASRLGYGARQLRRMLVAEVGAGPLALARAQRAQTARLLVETTDLGMAEIAFAAGFSSVRQFNDTFKEVLGRTPSELRERAGGARRAGGRAGGAPGPAAEGAACSTIALRLPFRRPMASSELLGFLGARSIAGIEEQEDGVYRRTLRLPHGNGVVSLEPGQGNIAARLVLADLRDLAVAVARCRRLLDLDADPVAVDAALSADPLLARLVAATPGRRVAGAVDGFELAVRAVGGQQVSVTSARAVLGRLVAVAGPGVGLQTGHMQGPAPGAAALSRVFPTPEEILSAPPGALAMPAARREAVIALARAADSGSLELDAGADPEEVATRLVALPGVGPWTASYVALRALGDPDVFLPSDLGVRRALERLGAPSTPRSALALAERWRPWRSYALMYLWSAAAPTHRDAA